MSESLHIFFGKCTQNINSTKLRRTFLPSDLPALLYTDRLSPQWASNAPLVNVVTALHRKVIQT